MSSAVAEIADGRPVDVEPMFQLKTPEPIEGFKFLPPPPRPYRPGELEARQQAQGPAPSDVAAQQRELYHDGFAPGVPGSELRETSADIYAPPPEAEAVAQQPERPAEAAPPETAQQQPGITVAEEGKPLAETDPELAAAHERIQQIEGGLLPEERAELEQVRGGLADAETKSAAINEAANCLKEAGM